MLLFLTVSLPSALDLERLREGGRLLRPLGGLQQRPRPQPHHHLGVTFAIAIAAAEEGAALPARRKDRRRRLEHLPAKFGVWVGEQLQNFLSEIGAEFNRCIS